jgi:hypothetical protein
MKKIIFSLLVLPLFTFCYSTNLNAQSSETDLDQAQLMKQFIGKWITETGEDSTQIWEAIPLENGYEVNVSWQANGETYQTGKGIMGFARQKKLVNWYHLWPYGGIARDVGKFVTDKTMTMERFTVDHKHVLGSFEVNIITPDKFKVNMKWRGMKETWDDAEVTEWIYTRVKK